MGLRAVVVIDYQNVHLTGHDVFNPHGNRHESLIHPRQFAARALLERNSRQRPGYAHAELSKVLVYRGLPHSDHDWEQNRRCLDQADEWSGDDVEVHLRDLKYKYQRDAAGREILDIHGKKTPIGRPQEKGIDVLCALACVREAANFDLVVLASRDTDLRPVLDEVHDMHAENPSKFARVETVSWFNRDAAKQGGFAGGSLRPTAPRRIWNTNLNRACFDASIDRNDYR